MINTRKNKYISLLLIIILLVTFVPLDKSFAVGNNTIYKVKVLSNNGGIDYVSGDDKAHVMEDDRIVFLREKEVWIYTPATNTWEIKEHNFPVPLWWGQMGSTEYLGNGKIIMFNYVKATSTRGILTNYTYIYDVNSNTWTQKADTPFSDCRVGVAKMPNGNIYVFGGDDFRTNLKFNGAVYNPATNRWQTNNVPELKRIKLKRCYILNNKLIYFGGSNTTGYGGAPTNVVFNIDMSNQHTVISPPLPSLNYECLDEVDATLLDNGKIFLSTASPSYGHNSTNKSHLYDPGTNTWKYGPNMPRVTSNIAQAKISDGSVYLFTDQKEIWVMEPNHDPTINIQIPNQNQIFHVGTNVPIRWNAYDMDRNNLSYNIKIGTSLGSSDIYNGSPNGNCDNTMGSHNQNTSEITLAWNNSTNRYEREIYVRITADDGNGGIDTKDVSYILVNYKPNVIVSTPVTTYNLNLYDSFTIKGKAWDPNSDKLTISATINNKTISTVVNSFSAAQPINDNWTLTWNGVNALGEGEYNDILITVTDDKGSSNKIKWTGKIIVKDILKLIDSRIKEHIPLTKNKDSRYIISNTDVTISQSSRNDVTINNIKDKLNKLDGEMYFIGQSRNTKDYISSSLTPDYGVITENNVDKIVSWMASKNTKKNTNIFLVDDYIDFKMLFADIEKDYQGISIIDKLKDNNQLTNDQKKPKKDTLQVMYSHNPNVFDNPSIKHNKDDGGWHIIQDIQDPFIINKTTKEMRGEWILGIKASDNTKNPVYDKYSEQNNSKFIIHDYPTAVIGKVEDLNNIYLTGEDSYDIDFESMPNNGIVKYEWDYELEDGTVGKYSDEKQRIVLPKIYEGKKITGYSLTVTDCYGAKASTKVANTIIPKLFSELHSEISKFDPFIEGIPASEELKVINIKTVPSATDTVEFSLYKNGNRKTPNRILRNPVDVEKNEILITKWKNIRNYVIPETLPDGEYEARVRAVKGSLILENKYNIRVHTPIDLKPKMSALVRTMESYNITSTTTKYANTVKVKAFKNTPYERIISLTDIHSEDNRIWNKSYTIPDVPDGNYIFEFTAMTPNGNKEVKELNVKVEALQVTAELMPNPALAGDEIIFTVDTKGFVDKIEIDVDPNIIAKDNRIGKYTYPTLRFNVDGSTYQKQDILKYILCVKTNQTLTKDNVRIRPEYTFKVRGYRGTNFKEVTLNLDVRRSVLDLLHPGVKTN